MDEIKMNEIKQFLIMFLRIDAAINEYEKIKGSQFDLFNLSKEEFQNARESARKAFVGFEE